MQRCCRLAFVICALFPLYQASAGAWLQPKHHGQFIAQASYYSSNEFFDSDSKKTAQPRFSKIEFQPYIEYGLLDNLTIGATAYTQQVQQSGTGNTGIADPEIFARTTLWKNDRSLISIQPLLKFRSQFARTGNPRGGSGSTDAELSLLYGRNLNLLSTHDYVDMRAGYRYRSTQLHDQWRADASLGVEVAPNWFVTPAIRSIIATKIRDTIAFSENGDQDYDLIKLEVGVNYRFTPDRTAGLTFFDHVYGAQTGSGMGVIATYTQGF